MKKFVSLILSLFMVLGVSTVTFANTTEPTEYKDASSIDLTKVYELKNEGTSNPRETFTFTIGRESKSDSLYDKLTDVPLPTFKDSNSITFDYNEATKAGLEKNTTIQLPDYDYVGIYTYNITEEAGNTAGVTYDANPLYLKVTVIQQGDKKVRVATLHYKDIDAKKTDKGFTNTYKAGNLAIKKEVTGNMGERESYFNVKVTLTAPEGTLASTVKVTGGSKQYDQTVTFVDNKAEITVQVKHDDTVTLTNLPYGVTYTVVEDDYTGDKGGYYAPQYSENDGTVNSGNESIIITNNKTIGIETGIFVDNLPYIAILGIVVAGIGAFFIKRRTTNNN